MYDKIIKQKMANRQEKKRITKSYVRTSQENKNKNCKQLLRKKLLQYIAQIFM